MKACPDLKYVELPRDGRKTVKLAVYSTHGDEPFLGVVEWFGRWRQYVFAPALASVFSDDCLLEVAAKVRELMEERRVRR